MKLICSPDANRLPNPDDSTLPVLLYGRAETERSGSVGAAIAYELRHAGLQPSQRAIDLLSLALSVVTADLALLRAKSPDGWTREIELVIEVADSDFWNSQKQTIEHLLRFLTTDIWNVSFRNQGYRLERPKQQVLPGEGAVALLSGGADSLVGVLDLVNQGVKPFVVSQIVTGDGEKQGIFAKEIGGGLRHLQLNHNARFEGEEDGDQRARSIVFLAYGIASATATQLYRDGGIVPLYVSENGLISINPPLTDARVGSLSTRTTHPVYFALVQRLLKAAGLRVELRNPYQFKTKGEMFAECGDQSYLKKMAHCSTSCGRFRRYGLHHCGRCVPCMIRRAAFRRWGVNDETIYIFADLSKTDNDHVDFDDVRSAIMAIESVREDGIDSLLGGTLASELIQDRLLLRQVAERGFQELKNFLDSVGAR